MLSVDYTIFQTESSQQPPIQPRVADENRKSLRLFDVPRLRYQVLSKISVYPMPVFCLIPYLEVLRKEGSSIPQAALSSLVRFGDPDPDAGEVADGKTLVLGHKHGETLRPKRLQSEHPCSGPRICEVLVQSCTKAF